MQSVTTQRRGGCSQLVLDYNSLEDPLQNIIHRFKHHPNIIAINEKNFDNSFKFHFVDLDEVTSEIKNGISTAMLQENVGICAPILTNILNDSVRYSAYRSNIRRDI